MFYCFEDTLLFCENEVSLNEEKEAFVIRIYNLMIFNYLRRLK